MNTQFQRTEMLIGTEKLEVLKHSRVAVFGLGGVGGFAVEALVRCGVGAIDIIDADKVSLTNLNRQIYALHSTIGKYKTEIAKERIIDINPACKVTEYRLFYLPENSDVIDFCKYDCVIDCIDTITAKIEIVKQCNKDKIPLVCCLGTANKLNPTSFIVTDLFKTQMDPIARVMRKKLKNLNIYELTVVYSPEQPQKIINIENKCDDKKQNINRNGEFQIKDKRITPASISFVPPISGLTAACEAINKILNK